MLELLNFILSDFWHFIGTILLVWLTVLPTVALLSNGFRKVTQIVNCHKSTDEHKAN